MSVIEGIGDEVVQFFSVVVVVVLAVAAWWSTSIRESHHSIRTVLILERRSRNRTNVESAQPPATMTDSDNAIDTGQQESADGAETEVMTDDSQDKDECESSNTSIVEGRTTTQNVEVDDSPSSTVGTTSTTETQIPSASEGNLGKRIAPFLNVQALLSGASNDSISADQPAREEDQIRIRLKYLNDDQKLVEGRLQEPLGEFKRRHFSIELSADKLVRLIFNGQVLGSDQQTLQACGLYDNCVVHCLVHSQRAPTRSPATPQAPTLAPASPSPSPPDWNLSTLLYTCLSLVLCLVWYCRYQYAQLFTLTTTAALIGLTGIFTVSIFSLYLPDQDGIPH